MARVRTSAAILCLAALAASCDSGSGNPQVPAGPLTLSEWGLFTDLPHQVPAEGVIPYDVIAPLFSDYATKHRFFRVPEGEQITYDANGDMVFPDGSVVVKTFGFLADLRDPTSSERLIETRLLVRRNGRWDPLVYVYDADGREARLYQYGRRVPVEWTNVAGEHVSIDYRIPDAVTCNNCHGGNDPVHLLGVHVRQLDREHDYGAGMVNQLDHFVQLGVLASAPAPADRHPLVDPFGTAPVEARARSYLAANCASCHRQGGGSDQSGLLLSIDITDPVRLGVCKIPAAAGHAAGGRRVDVMPGFPDESVLMYRVESEEAGVKMPELPSVLHHAEGAALLREWIAAMPPNRCGSGGGDAGIQADGGVAGDGGS